MHALDDEILAVTKRMLNAMHERDIDAYRACCVEDVSAFEWYIAPYRVDGIDFTSRSSKPAETVPPPASIF
jgi:hypothetical protein